ncbi:MULTISPECIES: endonuclease/exonuclease/phosphatase family protein [unclassified Carboxylicivirga]|uniref:endonuclease/exonuclease/phosphatase family protein n=1 Tax=Carboxylicivirga TaxID=1628153 RepID=UPI003D32E061
MMKYLVVPLCFFIVVACSKDTSTQIMETTDSVVYISNDESLNVGTLNIRYSNDNDGVNNWEYRKQWVVDYMNFFELDVIGFQEEKHDQTTQLKMLTSDNYRMIGKASSAQPGYEYNGIYYNINRVELLKDGRFWLSETPDVESIGWDAKYHRQVTWAKFKHKLTQTEFYVFNTHFSHVSDIARQHSAKLLKKKMQSIALGSPVIATGDFNFWPDTAPYKILTQNADEGVVLTEGRQLVERPYNSNYTGHCFGKCFEDGKIVDYIFVNDQVSVLKYGVLTEQRQDVFLSDHYPVIAKILFN